MKLSASAKTIAAVAALFLILCMPWAHCAGADSFVFAGRIFDAAGKTVENAEVFVYDSATIRRPADFISARTGKDGAFRMSLPRGKYWAVARVRKGDKYGPLLPGDRHSGEPAEVDPGSDAEVKNDFTVVDIRDAAKSRQKTNEEYSRLSGRIVGRDGKPVCNAYVFARTDSGMDIPPYLSRWTDESGEYVLYLPPGKYKVRGALRFPPEPVSAGAKELLVEVKVKEQNADVELSTGDEAAADTGSAGELLDE